MNARLRRPAVALLTTALAASVLGIVPAAHAADGTVTGIVTGPGGAISGVTVYLYTYNAEYDEWSDAGRDDRTDASGAYSIPAPQGQYRIGFDDGSGTHVNEYFQDVADVEDAQTITVADSGTFVADAVLETAAHITGTVYGPGSVALPDVQVSAWRVVMQDGVVAYHRASNAYSEADGSYDIGGLAAGTYRVEFDDNFAYGVSTYATEAYNDVSTITAGEDLTVTSGGLRAGVNADLALDSEISGRVTGAGDQAIENAGVDALVKVGAEWHYVGYASTDSDGTYVLDGLPAGIYRVEFGARIGDGYVREYWKNTGRIENATDVVLGGNAAKGDVDAQLIVGEHDQDPVVNVTVPTISGAPLVGSTLTASVGSWTPSPTEYYYDWLRDGEFIDGAYSATYVPTAADIGKRITVLVSAGADGYDYGHEESAPTAAVTVPVPPAPPVASPPTPTPTSTPTPAPVVDVPAGLAAIVSGLDTSGKPKVGSTVKVSGLDTVLRTSVSYAFQWYDGSKKITKATKSKLKITQAMKGNKISVKVTATAASTSTTVKLKVGKVR